MMHWLADVIVAVALAVAFYRQRRRHRADLHRVRFSALQARIAAIRMQAELGEVRRQHQALRAELTRAEHRLGETLRMFALHGDGQAPA